ncbi:MAG: dihydrodipicolinate synthase family protein [Candidatus Latescibacteria bacterium]|jgi:4-hydroxy-tetrahydrodipicolinate synthase|nr:dihydrodipicolinate synthase family protein [Candidatus Latescibacterota bacterium]
MDRYKGVVDRLKGPVVPLNICFTAEGTIDYPAQRRYVNWLCEQGVPVILLTYGSSEFSLLGDEDLWRLSAEMAAEVAGRALMIGSTSYWNVATCRKFLQHAEASGLDGVKVQMNPWMGQTDPAVFIKYHDQIQDAAPIPLLLWCNSGGGGVPIDAVAELARRPQVVGVKNDEDPFGYYYNLIRATSDEDFAVISGGQMRNIAFGYQVGSPAYLCTIAPFRPDIALAF